MAAPDFTDALSGRKLRLYRSAGGAPETFAFICIATSLSLKRQAEFDDTTSVDCANPDDPSVRTSDVRLRSWSLGISGSCDAKRFKVLSGDFDANAPTRYQVGVQRALADGGGTWTGKVWYEDIEIATQNRGIVTFSATMRGDGPLAWADAAA